MALATGCETNRATGPYFTDPLHPHTDEAVVYFYRPPKWEAPKAFPARIYAFNKVIRLDHGGYTMHVVSPGRYRISLSSKLNREDIWLDLQGGQTTFLKLVYVPILSLKGGQYEKMLVEVDKTDARNELPGCRLMEPDTNQQS